MESRRFWVTLTYEGLITAGEKADSILTDLAAQYGIPLIDASQLIPKEAVYFGDNVHLTDEGAEILARAAAEKIKLLSNKSLAN